MSVYADTSALRRLLLDDDLSDRLVGYLSQQSAVATSDLSVTELHRLGAWHHRSVEDVDDILSRFDRVPVTVAMFRQAGLLPHQPGDYLRSLDAIHLVAAIDTAQSAFVTYDRQQARAAAAIGLHVVAPGLANDDWYRR
jgi:predicted nucleic acid-binding protein